MSLLSRLLRDTRNAVASTFRYKGRIFQKPKSGTKESMEYNQKMNLSQRAREQVEAMRRNIGQNTPRICALLLLATSLPQIYYYYTAMWRDYQDRQYINGVKQATDWISFKNLFFGGVMFGLTAIQFKDFRAKNVVPQHMMRSKTLYLLLVPLALNLAQIGFIDNFDKKMILPTAAADAAILLIEAKLANEGTIPFWYFNLRYQQHVFDLIFIACMYFSLKNLMQHNTQHKRKYYVEPAI